jgi:hypothetical protein
MVSDPYACINLFTNGAKYPECLLHALTIAIRAKLLSLPFSTSSNVTHWRVHAAVLENLLKKWG